MWRDAEERTCWRISCPTWQGSTGKRQSSKLAKCWRATTTQAFKAKVEPRGAHLPACLSARDDVRDDVPQAVPAHLQGWGGARGAQKGDQSSAATLLGRALPGQAWLLADHAVWRQPAQGPAQSSRCCSLQLGQARSCTLLHPTFGHTNASDSAAYAMRHTTHRVHTQGQHGAKLLAALCTRHVMKANSKSRGTALKVM